MYFDCHVYVIMLSLTFGHFFYGVNLHAYCETKNVTWTWCCSNNAAVLTFATCAVESNALAVFICRFVAQNTVKLSLLGYCNW